jgi:hypothetical protein
MSKPSTILGDERGTTLFFSLLVLLSLAGLTAAGLLATTSDVKISGNYQSGTQALLTAESGLFHAQERINELGVVDFQNDIVANWESVFGAGAVTIQGYPMLSYSVAAASDPTDPSNYMWLEASGQAPNESQRKVRARLQVDAVFSPGAIYLPGDSVDPNFNGNQFLIDGSDTNLDGTHNASGDVPGIGTHTQDAATAVMNELSPAQLDNVIGQGGIPSVKMVNGFTSDQLLNEIVPAILARPGAVTNPILNGHDVFGTRLLPQVTHFTGNVNVTGNLSGAGVMVVDGGLTISGASDFTGLIIVQGTTQIATLQGNTTILGALWTTDLRLTVGGSASMTYSSQALALVNSLFSNSPLPKRIRLVSWKGA